MTAHRWDSVRKNISKRKALKKFKARIVAANKILMQGKESLEVIPVITPELWKSEFHKYTIEKVDIGDMWKRGDRFVTLVMFPSLSGQLVNNCIFHIVKRQSGMFGLYKYFLVPMKKEGYITEVLG